MQGCLVTLGAIEAGDVMAKGKPVALAAFLEGLRSELKLSMMNAAKDPTLAFELTKLDVELQVTAEASADGSGKVSFWVVEVGVGAKGAQTTVQTIKLSLQPIVAGVKTDIRVTTPTIARPPE
jgi:NTP-dependent ternary system trypsin peptidase co-occuring protein